MNCLTIGARRTLLLVLCALSTPVFAASADFPRPPQLEPDVSFWERVYSKVTTQGGLLHDDRYLDVVYEEITFAPGLSSRERADIVDAARTRYVRALRHLAAGVAEGESPSEDEQRVLHLFPANVSAAALLEAADHVRFQLGQADRFREGLVRSGAWEHHVEETLHKLGLPPELSALPHVESSFNPRAYSKVGAAGMWQFMRNTGKRWLRVDNVVDERLDPYKSTVAAAQFLSINYSMLGSWPLALTAYNHGAGGMQRAREQLGTDDITTIVRNYQSPSFGFASRNFYVSFLAALDIDRNPEHFFGRIERAQADSSKTVRLAHYMPVRSLEHTFGTDLDTLRSLNSSLMDPVWKGQRFVPSGFELRVPGLTMQDPERVQQKLAAGERYDRQQRDATHRVRHGETADRIAMNYGLTTRELLDFNGLARGAAVKTGMTLKIPPLQPSPSPPPAAESAGAGPDTHAPVEAPPDSGIYLVRSGETLAVIARRFGVSEAELMDINGIKDRNLLRVGQKLRLARDPAIETPPPATNATPPEVPDSAPRGGTQADPGPQAAEADAALVAGGESAPSADPSDYAVSGDAVTVQAAETLGHFAEWLGVTPAHLRTLNHMGPTEALGLGRRIRIDLAHVDAATFEERRQRFHHEMQDAFFQRFRIVGQEHYRLKSGESLWTLTQKDNVPVWLLRQYNPHTDFAAVRVGTEIVVPRVERVAPADHDSAPAEGSG